MRIGADRPPRRRLRGGETISGDLPLHLDVGSSRRGSPMDRSKTSRRRRDARFCLLQRPRSGEGHTGHRGSETGPLAAAGASIYPTLREAFIFSVVYILFILVESVVAGLFKGEPWQPRQSAADSRAARRLFGLLCRAHAVFRLPPCQSRARTRPFVHLLPRTFAEIA